MPYPAALSASVSARVCAESGVEIAHWLLLQRRTTGALMTAAKFAPSWNAPSVAAPPGEHGLGRHPAQDPDRRFAVGGKDPVLVRQREGRAGLDGLVAPEDRIRADPALAMVDDRALVVRAQEDEVAVEGEERRLVEAVHLAVRRPLPVADDPPHVVLGRKHLGCHGVNYRPRAPGARPARPRSA